MKMPAVELGPGGINVVERELPEPGRAEVLLVVEATGLCHSDLVLADRPPSAHPFDLPLILGHEIAGRVVEVGPGVDPALAGSCVVVYGPRGCRACPACRQGADNRCPHARSRRIWPPGLGSSGGLATHVVVRADDVVDRGDLAAAVAAPLTDAGLTAWHAVSLGRPALDVVPLAVVIGAGGVGHLALQQLRRWVGVDVVAVDRSPRARALAVRLGADALTDVAQLSAVVRDRSAGLGAGLVLDLVATTETLEAGVAALAPGGELAIVGVGSAALPVAMGRLPFDAAVRTPYWGTRAELREVLAATSAGTLELEIEQVALAEVPAAYERLRRGDVTGRLVAIPGAVQDGARSAPAPREEA